MPAKPPAPLTLGKLQELCRLCGLPRSGRKADVAARLAETLARAKPLAADARILSIDMGIRNLAYCLLSPPAHPPQVRRARSGPGRDGGGEDASVLLARKYPKARLHAWNRLSLVTRKEGLARAPGAEPASMSTQAADQGDFTVASLAQIATKLVHEHFLPLRPTHVLVERQRFRSSSAPAVFEWTLRVNTLEAMLYAIFSTLQKAGQWDGLLIPVAAKRVTNFVLNVDDPEVSEPAVGSQAKPSAEGKGTQRGRKKADAPAAANHKKQKINLLGTWLVDTNIISNEGNQAQGMVEAYLQRWKTPRRRKPASKSEPESSSNGGGDVPVEGLDVTKLDDLADSLLQGTTWLKWQDNMSLVWRTQSQPILRVCPKLANG